MTQNRLQRAKIFLVKALCSVPGESLSNHCWKLDSQNHLRLVKQYILCNINYCDCPHKKQLLCIQHYPTASLFTCTMYGLCQAAVTHPGASFSTHCLLRMGRKGWKWYKPIKCDLSSRICAKGNDLCLPMKVRVLANRRNRCSKNSGKQVVKLHFKSSYLETLRKRKQPVCKCHTGRLTSGLTHTRLYMGFGREK